MNKKTSSLMPVYADVIPDNIEPGLIYISRRFLTAIHLCACGCGKEVVTPLSKGEWKLTNVKRLISLYPSIGNWDYPCQSHYWVMQNRIVWDGKISREYIEHARENHNSKLAFLYNSEQVADKSIFMKFKIFIKRIIRNNA